MMQHNSSRRMFLRGVGVTIALPWLESMPARAAAPVPKRFAVLFMGNGVNGNHWWAKGSGDAMQLGRTLSPLEPVKQKVNFVIGLFNSSSVGMGIHPAQTGNLLSGAPLAKGAAIRGGTTVDQVIAHSTGRDSLGLACEPPVDASYESGFSSAYSWSLSWSSPSSPVRPEVDRARAFASVYGRAETGSILDGVRDSAHRLERQLGSMDRAVLDSYLTRVRDLERRVESASEDGRDRSRAMCDLIALGFQSDRTRVASLILARDLSTQRYPFLDVREDHHAASHDDLSDGYERIARFHVGQFAYLARTLDSMPEGDGTVLDHCCLLFLSNMWSGWKHDNRKLPVLTAGSLGGTMETGRALEYLYDGDENRKLCSLYLSLMDRFGIRLERFGDAGGRLSKF
jgi:hypothetical protein